MSDVPPATPPADNDPGPVPEPMAPTTDEPVRSRRENVAVRGTPSTNHDEIRKALEERQKLEAKLDDRPALSAKKGEWEKYAKSLGITTKGLTQDEIIAEVDALDGGE